MSTVTFKGEAFTLRGKVGLMPMMRFARAAKGGADANEMEGLAAMYDLLRSCIATDEWSRFEAHADDTAASQEELLDVVKQTYEALSSRPTSQPSDSSGGLTSSSATSTDDSSSPVIRRLETSGRSDLASVHLLAAEARRAG